MGVSWLKTKTGSTLWSTQVSSIDYILDVGKKGTAVEFDVTVTYKGSM